jgi:hypothetical protein
LRSIDENEAVQERGWRPKVWLRSKGLKIYLLKEVKEIEMISHSSEANYHFPIEKV